MNDFFKLLRDFVIFIPLGILIFGIFFSLIAVSIENPILLTTGLIIFLYGLVASYFRQIYKDYLKFLRIEVSSGTEYLERWKRYHRYYYTAQFLLLGVFIHIFLRFWTTIDMVQGTKTTTTSSVTPLFALVPFGWDAISAIVLTITAILIWVQAKATKELVENETRPVVEVGVINNAQEGTFMQFLNKKKEVPALVWVVIEVIVEGKRVKEEKLESRLIGKEPWRVMHLAYKTAGIAGLNKLKDTYKDKELEISLEIHLAPLFIEERKTRFYKKFYRFDFKDQQWIDTHWGIPDKLFMSSEN